MRLYYDSTPTAENPTWTRVSAIVDFPDITSRNNLQSSCTVVLRDFEGALYATWYARDFTRMLVTDDSETDPEDCNILFRGYLTNKKFHDRDLILEISGLAIELQKRSFGGNEAINYILEDGFVKTLNASNRIDLQRPDPDNPGSFLDFTWDVDQWILGDRTVGLMIKDKTVDSATKEWYAEDDLVLSSDEDGIVTIEGDYTDTQVVNDDNIYHAHVVNEVSTLSTYDFVITAMMNNGIAVEHEKFLKSITIEYKFGIHLLLAFAFSNIILNARLQIYNGSEYVDIPGAVLELNEWNFGSWGKWIEGVSIANGGDGGEYVLTGTDAELQNYFNTDGEDDYWELKGLRFLVTAKRNLVTGTESSFGLYIDYLNAIITYTDDDVNPIMHTIHGNGASYIICEDVDDWTQLGITEDVDGFQIGESTRRIVDDIAGFSNTNISIIIPEDEDGEILRPTGDVLTAGWSPEGLGNYFADVDDAVEDPDAGDGVDVYTSGTSILKLSVPRIETRYWKINEISITTRAKLSFEDPDPGTTTASVAFHWGNYTSSYKNTGMFTNECEYTYATQTWSNLTITDLRARDLEIWISSDSSAPGAGTVYFDVVYITVTYIPETWTHYLAREFKGQHCSDVLRTICLLEGAEWMEDHVGDKIKCIKKADYEDSGVSITQGDYDHDWEYEDQCNQVKYVNVWGRTTHDALTGITSNIFYQAVSSTATGSSSIQIIDDNIWTVPEAQVIAEAKLALLENKRPSIRIPLNGVNEDLQLGTTVNITMARPTVAATDYHIRMIQRKRLGKTGIQTIIYAGFGETDWDEKIIKAINKATGMSQKALTDKLTASPYDVGIGGVTWSDIGGATVGVENIITAELVNGQSIDNAIDTLITTHAGVATAHHVKYTDAEVNALIAAALVGGQAIDNAIDALIAAHAGDDDAHHTPYTNAMADARIALANHDTLLNPNGNADEQHLTAVQVAALHNTYTNAEAVQAVEDAGLVLSATKVITTGAENTAFSFGKNAVGIAASDLALFGYRGMTTSNYALKQDNTATTFINAATGMVIYFRLNDSNIAYISGDGLYLSPSMGVHVDGTPADATYTGIVLDIDTTGCTVGQAVYVDGTNSVAPADADQITTMPCIGICVAAGKVLTHGVYRNDAVLALATASKVYVSTTAGDLTTTAPSGNDDIVQVVGITVGADMIFVNPSLDWVKVVV